MAANALQKNSTIPGSINVSAPGAGASLVVLRPEAGSLTFNFDTDKALFARQGNSLTIDIKDGGHITVEGFFAVGEGGALPDLILVDGQTVKGADFLAAQAPGIDISTAAGPAASAAPSTGVGSYADGAGDLVGGVDRLGTLGTLRGERGEISTNQPLASTAELRLGTGAAGNTPDNGVITPDNGTPTPVKEIYNFRAVLYTQNYYQANTTTVETDPSAYKLHVNLGVGIGDVDAVKNSLVISVPDGAEQYFEVAEVTSAGVVVLQLTQAGKAALNYTNDLYNYMKVVVGGNTYTVQLVADQRNTFDASAPHNDSTLDSGFMDGGETRGDQHEGRRFENSYGTKAVNTSGLGDTVTFTEGVYTYGKNSVTTINTHTEDGKTASITLDQGGRHSGALGASTGGVNTIDGSLNGDGGAFAGQTHVNLAGTTGMLASNNGVSTAKTAENKILSVGGDVNIDATQVGMKAEYNALNQIKGVGGDVEIHAGAGTGATAMHAQYNGTNRIEDVDGNVRLVAEDNVRAMLAGKTVSASNGQAAIGTNIIANVHGAEGVTLEGHMDAIYGGENIIKNVTQGDVNINANYLSYSGAMNALYSGAKNTISDIAGNVNITADSTSAALKAEGGSNTIEHVGKDIQLNGLVGIQSSGGSNTIRDVAGGVSIEGKIGMLAHTQNSVNIIDDVRGAEGVRIIAQEAGMNAVSGNARNEITNVQNGDVVIEANKGLVATGGEGTNIIGVSGGDVHITTTTYGINSTYSSSNKITAEKNSSGDGGNVHIQVQGNVPGSDFYGMWSQGTTTAGSQASVNSIAADGTVSINVEGGSQQDAKVTGLRTTLEMSGTVYSRGENTLEASDVDIHVKNLGTGQAIGLDASYEGKNTITVDKSLNLEVSTESSSNTATGMYAYGSVTRTIGSLGNSKQVFFEGGTNTIQAADGSSGIEVHIKVAAGAAGKAFAMYADGGDNIIRGEGGNDHVKIQGDFFARNGGKNTIDLGAGTNVIELDGAMQSANGLSIVNGDGYDILILRADNVQQFNERFETWLKELCKDPDFQIDEVKVVAGADGQSLSGGLGWLQDLFGDRVAILSEQEYQENYSSVDAINHYAETVHAEAQPQAAPMMAAGTMAFMGEEAMLGHQNEAAASSSAQGQDAQHQPGTELVTETAAHAPQADIQQDASLAPHVETVVPEMHPSDVLAAQTGAEAGALPEHSVAPAEEVLQQVQEEAPQAEAPDGVPHADWSVLDGVSSGMLFHGQAENILLNLHSVDELGDGVKLDLGGLGSDGEVWLSLENGTGESVDADFLGKAFGAVSGVHELHLVLDQDDTLSLGKDSGWQRVDTTHSSTDASGSPVAFDTYQHVDGNETLTLYVQSGFFG